MTDKAERRKFLKAALAAMATATAGCPSSNMPPDILPGALCYQSARIPIEPDPAPESADEQPDKRAELTEQLKKLGEEEPPTVPPPGATCYKPMTMPPRD